MQQRPCFLKKINPYLLTQLLLLVLGISERNLWQRKKDGNIPYVKIGKLTKYHIPTIQIWIKENTQNGGN
jgi:hypothetical protein